MTSLSARLPEDEAWKNIRKLAEECIKSSEGERPELLWVKRRYEAKRREYGLSRADMDALLYRRMYRGLPETGSSTLKIRYWRTGHHVPLNRRVCHAFAQALELSAEETEYLVTAWMDKAAQSYDAVPGPERTLYWERRRRLEQLAEQYRLRKNSEKNIHALRRGSRAEQGYVRHLYYMDAMQYLTQDAGASFWEKHIYSTRYAAEWNRNMMLLGEIPRKTMIRHLILFGLPGLSVDWMNSQLEFLGYLPLTDTHTLTGGERLDRLLIGILKTYQELRKAVGSKRAGKWFLRCYRSLDAYFIRCKKPGFRFMYFKSLE